MCVRTSFSIMLSAVFLFGIAGSVNAGVIYNWAQIANSSDIHSTSGSLARPVSGEWIGPPFPAPPFRSRPQACFSPLA